MAQDREFSVFANVQCSHDQPCSSCPSRKLYPGGVLEGTEPLLLLLAPPPKKERAVVPPCPLVGARSLDDAALPARACAREFARADDAAAAAAAAVAAAVAPIEDDLTPGVSTDLTSSKPFSKALTRFSK